MNISIWISIIALVVSISAFIYTVSTNQSKVKISLSAKRNSLRVEVHDASMSLLSLIRKMIKDPQTDQHIRILNKLVDTSKGLVSIYKNLDKDLPVPWFMQTMVATSYENISAKLLEFTRVFEKAQILYETGDLNELEDTTEGMYDRIWGGTNDSEIQIIEDQLK